jgi:predicted phosphodiesterase
MSTDIFSSNDSVFRVSPYTLKHTNGNLILNFQTLIDKNLIIEDNGEKKYTLLFNKAEHYQIELKKTNCGFFKEIKISDASTGDVLYKTILPPAPCHTIANDNNFVFGFISDTQIHKDRHEVISKIIAHHHSVEPLQFLINGGDVVEEGTIEQDWLNYFSTGKVYLLDIPQIAALGNHDYHLSPGKVMPKYFQQFMRWKNSDKSGNLFFDFPEIQILILNSNFSKLEASEEVQTWNWLEEKMKNAQIIKKPIIIATHFPVYSSGIDHYVYSSCLILREKLVPLVEKYNVSLVLSGHTHMYERSLKKGIHYLVAGPAGGKPYTPTRKNEYGQFLDKDSLTFTKIKVTQTNFLIETYNQDNRLIDSFTLDKKKWDN